MLFSIFGGPLSNILGSLRLDEIRSCNMVAGFYFLIGRHSRMFQDPTDRIKFMLISVHARVRAGRNVLFITQDTNARHVT